MEVPKETLQHSRPKPGLISENQKRKLEQGLYSARKQSRERILLDMEQCGEDERKNKRERERERKQGNYINMYRARVRDGKLMKGSMDIESLVKELEHKLMDLELGKEICRR